ncbi:hypothetical protein [Rhizobium herbae]
MSTISAAADDIQYSGPIDEIAAPLAFHDGDVRATIETLLEDNKFLMEQLAITQIGMSIGFTRSWQPSFERD